VSKTLRVGVLGAGAIGKIHIDCYKEVPGVEVVAFAEKGDARAKERAKVVGVDRFYGDWKKMLAAKDIDAVDVCTPNYLHAPMTIAGLKAGKHVICEKPIAKNCAEARLMAAAAKKYKRKLMIAQNNRWSPGSQAVKRAVDAGYLGDIYYVRAHCLRRREIPGWGNFISKEIQGGGPMVDIGVHTLTASIDLSRSILL
jgi:predicted dehydrogenase